MRHRYIVRYKTNIIEGSTVVSTHRRPLSAISSAWSFVNDFGEESKHLAVSVFYGDICIYRIIRSENGVIGKHSEKFSFRSDYGDLSRVDAHYAVFSDNGGHVKQLIDYGNNMDFAFSSGYCGKRMMWGFFTERRRRNALLWCSLLVFAMVLFLVLCMARMFTVRSGFDQISSVIAVVFSFFVVYKVIEYVMEYWRSCSYVNFDVMTNIDYIREIKGITNVG